MNTEDSGRTAGTGAERHGHLLIIDDDTVFAQVLARAMTTRGFATSVAHDAATALAATRRDLPTHAVLDLKLGADNGLALIPQLLAQAPKLRILLLTGYASIATAVEAIKRGAHDYLAKPVDADAVLRALLDEGGTEGDPSAADEADTPPLRRLEWEHIQRVLAECEGNISEAARRLGLHRRTLQRKLAKHPVRERPNRST
ncbi:response regulator transcription factor [Tahibacter amnicola]|uniref:Response regulator n=1 Tax=Tahibacter amnicola TaxID=2976241 RepID=A0ABY6BFR6_9GAMM|nr:response regulator [Tahibacter amnicola]UXI67451.1 response regulator [Tahibacter amnicola]